MEHQALTIILTLMPFKFKQIDYFLYSSRLCFCWKCSCVWLYSHSTNH